MRAIAIIAPGMFLSHPPTQSTPSISWPFTAVSIASAMTSRETSEYFMPSVPMPMPSVTVGTPNTCGIAPAAFTAAAARSTSGWIPALQGFMVECPLATPTIAFSKSPSPKPTARSIARLGERASPWVMVLLLQLSDMGGAPDFSVAFRVILTERPSRTLRTAPSKRARGAAKAAPHPVTGMTCRLFGMKLQVSARQGSAARVRDTGTRNGDVEGVVPDSRLAVIASLVHREGVPVGVVHARAAGEGHAGCLATQPERIDLQAMYLQARGVAEVLELAVERTAPRTGVESERGDIAARPEFPAAGHEGAAPLGCRDEIHVAVGRSDDNVDRDRPRQRVVEHHVDRVHCKSARVHAVAACDLLIEDYGAPGYRNPRVRRGRHVRRGAPTDAEADESRALGRARRRGPISDAARHRDHDPGCNQTVEEVYALHRCAALGACGAGPDRSGSDDFQCGRCGGVGHSEAQELIADHSAVRRKHDVGGRPYRDACRINRDAERLAADAVGAGVRCADQQHDRCKAQYVVPHSEVHCWSPLLRVYSAQCCLKRSSPEDLRNARANNVKSMKSGD